MSVGRRSERGGRATTGRILLGAFGLYALVLGMVNFLAGGFMVLGGGPATERHFIGHITEAHASTLIGLGLVAWAVARSAAPRQHMLYPVMALANILGLVVVVLWTPASERGTGTTFLIFSQLAWGVAFFYLYCIDIPKFKHFGGLGGQGVVGSISLISFSVLLVASGLVWMLAPLTFATAAAGSLAGPSAAFAGQTRGASDIAIGVLAWSGLARTRTSLHGPLLVGLLVANVLLIVAGLLAQYSVLYTPTRWVVEGLHVLWTAGFTWMLARYAGRPPSSIDSTSGIYRNTTYDREP